MREDAAAEIRQKVDALYRSEFAPRTRHADPRAGRFRPGRGGDARRVRRGGGAMAARRRARPIRGRGSFRPGGSRRSTPYGGAPGSTPRWTNSPSGSTPNPTMHAERDDEGLEDDRLRLIFTCCHPALPPDAQRGADAARSLRPDDRRDRPRLSHRSADAGPADRARQGEDPRCADSLSGALAGRPARPAGRGAARDLSRVQRGIFGIVGRIADAARSLGRGDPAGAAADRTAAGARGGGACWR